MAKLDETRTPDVRAYELRDGQIAICTAHPTDSSRVGVIFQRRGDTLIALGTSVRFDFYDVSSKFTLSAKFRVLLDGERIVISDNQ